MLVEMRSTLRVTHFVETPLQEDSGRRADVLVLLMVGISEEIALMVLKGVSFLTVLWVSTLSSLSFHDLSTMGLLV